MTSERVLLLTEATPWGDLGRGLLTALGATVDHVPWSWGEDRAPLDTVLDEWEGRHVICFKADCVVPPELLSRTPVAINFHPGPPWLRGVACPEQALARGDLVYGVTCHQMIAELDAGKILDVRTFAVPALATVDALRQLVGREMLRQLEHIWLRRAHLPVGDGAADPIWAEEICSLAQARAEGLLR